MPGLNTLPGQERGTREAQRGAPSPAMGVERTLGKGNAETWSWAGVHVGGSSVGDAGVSWTEATAWVKARWPICGPSWPNASCTIADLVPLKIQVGNEDLCLFYRGGNRDITHPGAHSKFLAHSGLELSLKPELLTPGLYCSSRFQSLLEPNRKGYAMIPCIRSFKNSLIYDCRNQDNDDLMRWRERSFD